MIPLPRGPVSKVWWPRERCQVSGVERHHGAKRAALENTGVAWCRLYNKFCRRRNKIEHRGSRCAMHSRQPVWVHKRGLGGQDMNNDECGSAARLSGPMVGGTFACFVGFCALR